MSPGEIGYYEGVPSGVKSASHRLYREAVRVGRLSSPSRCEECGEVSRSIVGHHDDYLLPLAVRWLCGSCHVKHHVSMRAPTIDVASDLRRARLASRQTQKEAAQEVGVSAAAFGMWERGKIANPQRKSVRGIRAYLDSRRAS